MISCGTLFSQEDEFGGSDLTSFITLFTYSSEKKVHFQVSINCIQFDSLETIVEAYAEFFSMEIVDREVLAPNFESVSTVLSIIIINTTNLYVEKLFTL